MTGGRDVLMVGCGGACGGGAGGGHNGHGGVVLMVMVV